MFHTISSGIAIQVLTVVFNLLKPTLLTILSFLISFPISWFGVPGISSKINGLFGFGRGTQAKEIIRMFIAAWFVTVKIRKIEAVHAILAKLIKSLFFM